MTKPDAGGRPAAPRKTPSNTALLIPRGRPGQCNDCGAFRIDGAPVTVHFHGCAAGPDGWQIGPW